VPSSARPDIASAAAPHMKSGQKIVLRPGRTGGALGFRKMFTDQACRSEVIFAEAGAFVYAGRSVGPHEA